MVAYSFARLQWAGRTVAFAVLLGTMMIPPQVTMIPQFLIFQKLGWYNTLKPLWITSFFASACAWVSLSLMKLKISGGRPAPDFEAAWPENNSVARTNPATGGKSRWNRVK